MRPKANQPHSRTASRRNRTTKHRVDLVAFGRNRHLLLLLLGPCQGNDEWLLLEPCPKTGPSWMDRLLCAASFILHPEPIHTTHVTSKSSVRCLEFLLLLLLLLVGTRRVTLSRCLKEASLHTPFYPVLEKENFWW